MEQTNDNSVHMKYCIISKVIVLWAKFTICIVLWGRHIITTLMYMHSNATIYVDSQQGPVIIVCMTMSWLGSNWRWNESNCYMCIFVRMLNFDRDKDLYSRKDMNFARFNIDCMYNKYVAWWEQVRLLIVQFVDDARALINGINFHRFNILNQYL